MAQDAVLFPDSKHIHIDTPQAREIVGVLQQLNVENI